jgi:hypothetical protein
MCEAEGTRELADFELVCGESVGVDEDDGQGAETRSVELFEIVLDGIQIW